MPDFSRYPRGVPSVRDAEAGRRWRDAQMQQQRDGRPKPVVLVGATAPAATQVPGAARSLINAARDSGWQCRATYAVAEIPAWTRVLAAPAKDGAKVRQIPAELVETLCVRLAAPGWRGYAVWSNGRFDSGWLRAGAGMPLRYGQRQIVAVVRAITIEPQETAA